MFGKSPTGTQVSEIIDGFLDWCQRHRSKGTFGWHKYRCDLFWKHLKNKNLRHLAEDEFKPFHFEEWIAAHPT